MLSDIINEFKKRGALSVSDVANRFQLEVSAVEGMLQTLERKGRIARVQTKCGACKGCVNVKPEDVAIFQWVEK